MPVSLFSVRLDDIASAQEMTRLLRGYIEGKATRVIFTPNPEILLRARSDRGFVEALNTADLSLPDGAGINTARFLLGKKRIPRYPGIDTAERLLEHASHTNHLVLLLGGKSGTASAAAVKLRKRYPGLRIATAGEDVCFRSDGIACTSASEAQIQDRIASLQPTILLVGLGAPKQENWIVRHKNDFPSVCIMMAVGGAFDIWSGNLRRAPKILRICGLEWLWRLAQEPRRIVRIFRATLLFLFYSIYDRSHDT